MVAAHAFLVNSTVIYMLIALPSGRYLVVCRNYWRDYDTALFILKHLYRDIPEEPSSSEEANGGSSKNENGSTGWTDQREAADEELPLTFAERVVIRNFSRKAKKIMQS